MDIPGILQAIIVYLPFFLSGNATVLFNNTSKTDLAPWCYKWDWMDGWIGWKSPGGGMYRAPYGANNQQTDRAIIGVGIFIYILMNDVH